MLSFGSLRAVPNRPVPGNCANRGLPTPRPYRERRNPDADVEGPLEFGPPVASRNDGADTVEHLPLRIPARQVILTVVSVIVVPDALPQEPLAALRVLTDSEHELHRIRREQVIAARSAGASWQQIGDALGVTRQSAWESFTAATRAALASNVDANSELDEDDALELAVDEVRAVRLRRATS